MTKPKTKTVDEVLRAVADGYDSIEMAFQDAVEYHLLEPARPTLHGLRDLISEADDAGKDVTWLRQLEDQLRELLESEPRDLAEAQAWTTDLAHLGDLIQWAVEEMNETPDEYEEENEEADDAE
jgi:hypothetical protein